MLDLVGSLLGVFPLVDFTLDPCVHLVEFRSIDVRFTDEFPINRFGFGRGSLGRFFIRLVFRLIGFLLG